MEPKQDASNAGEVRGILNTWPGAAVPSRRFRLKAATIALPTGLLAGVALSWMLEIWIIGQIDWAEMLFINLVMAAFATMAWACAVIPLALWVRHEGWLFSPVAAPLVGGGSGVALLAVEYWVFFDVAPWRILRGSFNEEYLLGLAGVIGGVLWSTYSWAIYLRGQGGNGQDPHESPR